MKYKFLIGIVVVIVIIILVVILNGSNAQEDQPESQGSSIQETQSNTDTPESQQNIETDDTSQEIDFSLEMKNFSFTPNAMEVKAGETIRVKLTNTSGTHDFVIDELNVQSSLLGSGEEEIIEITAPSDSIRSTYEFYCSVGNHRELGMVGELKIT